jgi:formamidopyrimidine-DNA glycosylase
VTRNPALRWPVAARLGAVLTGRTVQAVDRRAKYLLFRIDGGTLVLHLGMSGSLRVVAAAAAPDKFDHFDLVLGEVCLRLRDPRRFGSVHWTSAPAERHPLLRHLGPEPLGPDFSGDYLYRITRGRRRAVRELLLDSRIVAGIGNIYANEALFRAGIDPRRHAGRIRRERYVKLVEAIRNTLERAILAGGTTLRDFRGGDGRPGYFQQTLAVYDRAGAACPACGGAVRRARLGQRSVFFCPRCQR